MVTGAKEVRRLKIKVFLSLEINMIIKICLSLVIANFLATRILAENICPEMEVLDIDGVTCDVIEDIVNTHNELRENIAKGLVNNQPPASNMREMHWDDELASNAQDWANHCTFQHDEPANREVGRFQVGQNIALTKTKGPSTRFIEFRKHIKNWFNEHTDYNFGPIDKNLLNTGHYTQIAWANTYLVGCGYSRYKNNSIVYQLYVCNYGPAGNHVNKKPYNVGKTQRCPRHFVLSKKFPHLCDAEETPSNACKSNEVKSMEKSLDEESIETSYRRNFDQPTRIDNDFLYHGNSDDNRKSKKHQNGPSHSSLKKFILSITVYL